MKTLILSCYFILLCGCSELVHTQIQRPVLRLDNNILNADGVSRKLITVEFDDELAVQQKVYVTTTNGKLYTLPVSATSQGRGDTITLQPGSRKFAFFVESSNVPDDHVVVSATVNNFVALEVLQFTRSCPDEVKLDVSKPTMSLSATDSIQVVLTMLRDDDRPVSNRTRVDITTSEHGQAPHTIFADERGIARLALKPNMTGDGKVDFTLKTPCTAIVKTVVFKVE
ncbi:MAG TPA: hypothetical protein VD927_00860 [Chryseosolibacter sp.]|nr:hypothetical protein [Chryseosolibacter sp.]